MAPDFNADLELESSRSSSTVRVGTEDLTKHLDEGNVLSTPALLSRVEDACMEHLRHAEATSSVGSYVELHHVAPATLGDELRIDVAMAVEGRRRRMFQFEVRAGGTIVATGRHRRHIIEPRWEE